MRCETCKFFEVDENGVTGECRRNPKKIVDAIASYYLTMPGQPDVDKVIDLASKYPTAFVNDGCGEWVRG